MDKMRQEFEAWVSAEFGVDFSEMFFDPEIEDVNTVGHYRHDSDCDAALLVTAMFRGWKASRASLCVELPCEWYDIRTDIYVLDAELTTTALDQAGVSYK